jgi:hypothetical protein
MLGVLLEIVFFPAWLCYVIAKGATVALILWALLDRAVAGYRLLERRRLWTQIMAARRAL